MNLKSLFFTTCFIGMNANAAVDYVAIGKLINQGKSEMAETRAGVVCLLQQYEADQSCANLEISNENFKKILADTISSASLYDCGDQKASINAKSPDYIAYTTLQQAKRLASDAKPDDAINAIIERYERSLTALQAELEETYAKVKFNETYVSKCMFGLEPSPVTIKALICQ